MSHNKNILRNSRKSNEDSIRYKCAHRFIFKKSNFYWIWEGLLKNEYTLCVTTDILLEYEEIIAQQTNPLIAEAVLDAITDLPNLVYVTKYVFWQLIKEDADDNKFVDCAIASNARYIVTEDKHFNILKTINFPKVDILDIKGFQKY